MTGQADPGQAAPPHSDRSRRARWLIVAAAIAVLGAWAFRPLWRGEVPAGRDIVRLFVPSTAVLHDALVAGELPWWNPNEALGRAFVAELHTQAFYPLRVIPALLLPPWRAVTCQWLLHVLLAGWGIFALVRRLGRTRIAALISGVGFALSPLFSTLAWQLNVLCAAAWSGWLVLTWLRLLRGPGPGRAAAFAAVVALDFLAGSPETMVWQGLVLLLIVAVERPRLQRLAIAGGAGVLGIGLVAQTLLPALELAGTARHVDLEDVLRWSMSWPQLAGALLPTAELPMPTGYYSGDQHFLERVYLGAVLGLCALAAPLWRRPNRPFALGAVSLALLSLGRFLPPVGWLLLHSPLVRFRYPAKYFLGAAFCVAVLAGAGADRLLARARTRAWGGTARWVGGFSGALLLIVVLLASSRFRAGTSVGALYAWLAAAGGGIALRYARRRAGWVLAAVAWADLLLAHQLFPPAGWASLRMLERPSLFASKLGADRGRVSIRTDVATEVEEESVRLDQTRDALVPNTAALEGVEQFEVYGSPIPPGFAQFLVAERAVFDLAGVTHYVRRSQPFADLTPVAQVGPFRLDRSDTAYPRAFVVQRAVRVGDQEAARRVSSPEEPARHTAFLATGAPLDEPPCPENRVEPVSRGWNFETLRASTCRPGYLVESTAFYPGWQAEVDGQPAPIERVDLGLRAVRLPEGAHTVAFVYRPPSVRWGFRLGVLSALLWGALVLAAAWRVRPAPRPFG